MPNRNENLEIILCDFLPAAEAHEAAEVIASGERMLWENPAPAPSADLLADINAKVGAALHGGRRTASHWFGRVAAVCAAIVMATSILFLFSGDAPHEIAQPTLNAAALPAPGWWDDHVVEGMSAEIDRVLETMISISVEDCYIAGQKPEFDLAELEELELIAMSDDFWKG